MDFVKLIWAWFWASWLGVYTLTAMEVFSQGFNALHDSRDANQTFSSRLAIKRDSGDLGYPAWYWSLWIRSFEYWVPGHLDWAQTPD